MPSSRWCWTVVILLLTCSPLSAQWIDYPAPGLPRTPDGKPNLAAPAPRKADGKPDLSGVWDAQDKVPCAPGGCACPAQQFLNIAWGLKDGLPYRPGMAELAKARQQPPKIDEPLTRCLPVGAVERHTLPTLRKIVQAPGLLLILNEYNLSYRQIFTDGRPPTCWNLFVMRVKKTSSTCLPVKMRSRRTIVFAAFFFGLCVVGVANAEVVKIDITRKDDFGTHNRIIGRVHFAVDPKLPANRIIADLDLAPRNKQGKVEFTSDLLFFVPKEAGRARGTVFFEIVNRGRDQSLAIMSGAQQRDLSPESWVLGDRFVLEQGFTVAFLGWQFDVDPSQGLTFGTPIVPVRGVVRESHIAAPGRRSTAFLLKYCAADQRRQNAELTFRSRMDDIPQPLPRESWRFASDGWSVHVGKGFGEGLNEAVYEDQDSPVTRIGRAAIRDFVAFL